MNDRAIEQEIQAKGKTAPRVTLADLEANIHHIETVKHVTQSGQVLRWSVLITQSGFAVVGKPSVAVSPENDDAEIGEQVAFENSRNELWPLMGYALKQQLHEQATAKVQPAPGAAHPGYSTMQPHQQRVVDEAAELDSKSVKLLAFFDTTTFAALDEAEQSRLRQQYHAMACYSAILGERIDAFGPAHHLV
jgi:hypothetical protein